MAIDRPKVRKWTVNEYFRMADAGLFRKQRVELIEGVIIRMPAQKSRHVAALELTEQALERAFGPSHTVRTQVPLQLSRRSAPEPDLAVVVGGPRDYVTAHPTTALLIVEVSDTTLAYDRRRKASLYARFGIADYWIVNLRNNVLEVRRNPVADPTQRYGFGYADVRTLTATDSVSPLALPAVSIAVADLLP